MSIVGIGTDIVAVKRIAVLLDRHGARFLARCFTEAEQAGLRGREGRELAAAVAARWAAKEALLKALGGAIGHVPYRSVAVLNDSHGAPYLGLSGSALTAMQAKGGLRALVSLSHERKYAVATVVVEG